MNYKFYAMKGVPEEGMVFRFTPKFNLPTTVNTTGFERRPQFYPNPVNSQLNIKYIKAGSRLSIYHMNGALVKEIVQAPAELQLDLNTFPEGMYMVRVADDNGIITEKLLKLP